MHISFCKSRRNIRVSLLLCSTREKLCQGFVCCITILYSTNFSSKSASTIRKRIRLFHSQGWSSIHSVTRLRKYEPFSCVMQALNFNANRTLAFWERFQVTTLVFSFSIQLLGNVLRSPVIPWRTVVVYRSNFSIIQPPSGRLLSLSSGLGVLLKQIRSPMLYGCLIMICSIPC